MKEKNIATDLEELSICCFGSGCSNLIQIRPPENRVRIRPGSATQGGNSGVIYLLLKRQFINFTNTDSRFWGDFFVITNVWLFQVIVLELSNINKKI